MRTLIQKTTILVILFIIQTSFLYSQYCVYDIDSNGYNVVKIGTQVWLKENLKTTHYSNGDSIPNITDDTTTGAYCNYNNDTNIAAIYGRLYNWYAVNDSHNICPTGWHVPTDAEWTTLTNYLINYGYGYQGSGDNIAKSMAATSGWEIYSTEGRVGNDQASNNSSGFTALPGGVRYSNQYDLIGYDGNWWSSTEFNTNLAGCLELDYNNDKAYRYNDYKSHSKSVRCIKDFDSINNLTISVDSLTNASCHGYSDGSIDISVSGGTKPYNYFWSTDTTQDIDGLKAGIYYITVLDCYNMTNDSIIITEPPAVPANAGSDVEICKGTSSTLSASGGTSYSWNTGDSLNEITVSPTLTTKYTVTVTNAQGCKNTDEVRVFVNTLYECENIPPCLFDIDGNGYHVVKIGTQVWLKENLKVIHYSNGDSIPNITDITQWDVLKTGVYCNYNNDINNANTYGRLYNWYAVTDSRNICPLGWHVPTDAEWSTLIDYLGGLSVAGGKLKEAGTTHWQIPNTGTNESDFTALPGGYHLSNNGTFSNIGRGGIWWSQTEYPPYSTYSAYGWSMGYDRNNIERTDFYKKYGFSVRCLRDFDLFGNLIISIDSQTNATCLGYSDGSADISASGGIEPYNYLWSTGNTTHTINGLKAGTYFVTVYDNCLNMTKDSIIITEPPSIANAGIDVEICKGTSATLSASGGISYSWNTGDSIDEITVSPTTTITYIVTVTDNKGCSNTDNVKVTVDTLSVITPAQSIYCGEEIVSGEETMISTTINYSGTNKSYTYSWSPVYGLNDPTIKEPTVNPRQTTTYTITVNAPVCSATSNVVVTVTPQPFTIAPEICIITIDIKTGKNLIIWNREEYNSGCIKIDGYYILRQKSLTVWDTLGYVPFTDGSAFVDTSSTPELKTYNYKIVAKDTLGRLSPASQVHTPLLLQYGGLIDDMLSLSWTTYKIAGSDYQFDNYILYASEKNDTLVVKDDAILYDKTSINVITDLTKKIYYRIGGVMVDGCYPDSVYVLNQKKKGVGTTKTSISNQQDNRVGINTQIRNNTINEFTFFPNPTKTQLYVYLENYIPGTFIEITDIYGRVLLQQQAFLYNSVNTSGLKEGVYLLIVKNKYGKVFKKFVKM